MLHLLLGFSSPLLLGFSSPHPRRACFILHRQPVSCHRPAPPAPAFPPISSPIAQTACSFFGFMGTARLLILNQQKNSGTTPPHQSNGFPVEGLLSGGFLIIFLPIVDVVSGFLPVLFV